MRTSTRPGSGSPIEMVDTTGPAFWLRPVWSTEWAGRSSMRAAAASIWLTVTTPVPPMPGIRSVAPAAGMIRVGSGASVPSSTPPGAALGRRPWPGSR